MVRNNRGIELEFFKSALAIDSGITSKKEILAWVALKNENAKTRIKQIPLDQMRRWCVAGASLVRRFGNWQCRSRQWKIFFDRRYSC